MAKGYGEASMFFREIPWKPSEEDPWNDGFCICAVPENFLDRVALSTMRGWWIDHILWGKMRILDAYYNGMNYCGKGYIHL